MKSAGGKVRCELTVTAWQLLHDSHCMTGKVQYFNPFLRVGFPCREGHPAILASAQDGF